MKKTLEKIVRYVVDIAEPELIILFGSMADGRANIHSDVDLLIVSGNDDFKHDIAEKIVSYSAEFSLKVDVLIYSMSEIEREKKHPSSFISAIIKSGKNVYEKTCVVNEN